jgi:hypothetical protein
VKVSFSNELSKFEEMTYDHIPNKIYVREDLPNEVIRAINNRNFLIEQTLENYGYVLAVNENDMILKIALNKNVYRRDEDKVGQI